MKWFVLQKMMPCLLLLFFADVLAVEKRQIDFVVGVDGDFKAALNAAQSSKATESNHFVIFFPDGEYDIGSLTGDENQRTNFTASHVSLVGQSIDKTIIYNKSINEGISVSATLYFNVVNDIYLQDLTLLNKAIYGNEANCGSACRHVVVQQVGDKFIYKNVKLLSGQDTYYTKKSGASRTYWEGGQIEGTVDFICGDGNVFFEGTKLVMRRSGGYITAAATTTEWGYVFNNAILEVSNSSYNGTFYLGRSWKTAKTVFLNTLMKAEPTAVGWGPNMNSAPQVFGEYNSKNANGGNVNTSQRRTYFDGSKDGSTATLKTVWNASDAAKYTQAAVLSGTDSWSPNKLTQQISAPKIEQVGGEVIWENNDNVRCWVVFVNGKYKTNVVTPAFSLESIPVGSKISIRAANAMGGLGAYSNEISTVESDVVYYNVSFNEPIGGQILTSFSSMKVAEGKTVTFTAKPISGWAFEGWNGSSVDGLNVKNSILTFTVTQDIELSAIFTAKGVSTFQAEEGQMENAVFENTNTGFQGSGYVNFGTENSYAKVPVYTEGFGEYKLVMTYANGSNAARSLSILTDSSSCQEVVFKTTSSWTTYVTQECFIRLPLGASNIVFSTLNGNDGPNLDQIELIPINVTKPDSNTTPIRNVPVEKFNMESDKAISVVYNIQGVPVRRALGMFIKTEGLSQGVYIVQTFVSGKRIQRIIYVK
jgi:pectin methylesterase-like acyl-CoA thioesterase